ncbi:MAG: hypothetical protein KJZ83_00365 [Burkholderiaceae bacterium]|nr:hypothetical protein [Burkholderiaceae bacterium]
MPTVKLLKPARLSTLGRIWERGVVVEDVDADTARKLDADPRFEVRGLGLETIPKGSENSNDRPSSKGALYAAIREASDKLDVDDESNFTATGKPQVQAIEKILGYGISAQERDEALKTGASKGQVDTGEDKGGKKGGVVIKKVSSQKPAVPDGEDAKAEAGADPTTSGAVEV